MTTPNRMISHPLDENLILFREGDRCFNILNPLARWIWESYRSGMALESIGDCLVKTYGISPDQAIGDVQALFDALQKNPPLSEPQTFLPLDRERTLQTGNFTLPVDLLPSTSRKYSLGGCGIQVDIHDAQLIPLLTPLFQHLEDNTAEFIPDHHIAIYQELGQFALIVDESQKEYRSDRESMVIALYWQLAQIVSEQTDWLIALHGGVVEQRGVSVVFSAAGGSGKSTLIAALAASGYRSLGDEGAFIGRRDNHLIPIPLPICIKEGSWKAISAYYPTFNDRQVFIRFNQKVRFLPSCQGDPVTEGQRKVNFLVFVKYKKGVDTNLSRISATEVLQGLIKAECLFGVPLKANQVVEQLNWIKQLEAYQLTYGKLEEAVAVVDGLIESFEGDRR